ncbi:hypothetical protein MIR68_007664 [Amoeboaphelidium protococcarum]|nr:hypothetical protein MIR68_007664 [Amoeboaphelidium protococcarum]
MTIPSDCAFSQTQTNSIRQQAQEIQQQLQSVNVEDKSDEFDESLEFWCALSRLINAPQDYFKTAIYALVPPLDEFIKHEMDGEYCSRIGMPILNKQAFIRVQLQQKLQQLFTTLIETRRFDILDFAVPVLKRQSPMDKDVQYIACYVDNGNKQDKQNSVVKMERQIQFALVNVNNAQDLNSLLSVILAGPSIHYLERIIESPLNAKFIIPPHGDRIEVQLKIHETRQNGRFRVSLSVSSQGTQTSLDLVHDALCQRLRYLQQNKIEIAKGAIIADINNNDDSDDGLMRDDRVDIVDIVDLID